MTTLERFRGSLVGLAAGDAIGTTLEFQTPGTFTLINDMVGGGPFKLQPGEWTDDTSMALCLAESLIEKTGFDPKDQLKRYLKWYRSGYLGSNGTCFDIGFTIREALHLFENTGDAYCGSNEPDSAGNGSIMRLAPAPLFYSCDPLAAIIRSGESSMTTHRAIAAVDACRYLGALIVGAVNGIEKDVLLSAHYSPVKGLWDSNPLCLEIFEIADGSFKEKSPPEIRGNGYVVNSLEAALWAFWTTDSFVDGIFAAVNLGDDADTTGAVYGQLAGAYYGLTSIPDRWLEKLAKKDIIFKYADRLHSLSQSLLNNITELP